MKQTKIFNIKLIVEDLNKSIEFYKTILGSLGFVSSCYFKDEPMIKAIFGRYGIIIQFLNCKIV